MAYTDENDHESYTYLAVKDAVIYTPFPETSVQQLGLIDLPGLGELNPTVERRHTEGFADDVDLVMLIRRPSSERVDWDKADQDTLEVLKRAAPTENLANFVIAVHNEGGCDADMAEKSMQSMRVSLRDYIILPTRGQTSEELYKDVLEEVLNHLARKLPEMDKQIVDKIAQTSQSLWKKISRYAQGVHDALKAANDGGYDDEIYNDQAKDTLGDFSNSCQIALDDLEFSIKKDADDQRLLDSLARIQDNIDAYFENGLERKTNKEDWIRSAVGRIARHGNSSPVFNETGQNIRVKIAEEFTALDHVYKLRVDELLAAVAREFDAVLPGFCRTNPHARSSNI